MRINRGGFSFARSWLIISIIGVYILSLIALIRPKASADETDLGKKIGLCLFLIATAILLFYLITDYRIEKKRRKIIIKMREKEYNLKHNLEEAKKNSETS